MSTHPEFMTEAHDPNDPSPWRAIYLDRSIAIDDRCKQLWLSDASSKSRQFLLPFARPLARATIVLFQVLKTIVPKRLNAPRILHRLLEWNMRTWLSPNANELIFRHFYLGSEILAFIARNTRGISMTTSPLKPTTLGEVRDNLYLKHDINLFNFVIELNTQLREKNLELAPIDELDFGDITDGTLPFETMPNRWHNFVDLQTAIEIYTPLYQLLLTDNDFWRASTSLQLDETIGIYVAKLLGTPQNVALINNKHPMVPLSTLRAGFRLVLHGLATETQHAMLVQFKRQQAASSADKTPRSRS